MNRLMSVAWECMRGYYGGLGVVVSRLTPSFLNSGFDVWHFCTEGDFNGCLRVHNVPNCKLKPTSVGRGGLLNEMEAIRLSEICLDFLGAFDIVLTHDFHSAGVLIGAENLGLKTMFFLHSVSGSLFEHYGVSYAEKVFVNSYFTKRAMVENNLDTSKVRVVYFPPPYTPIIREKPKKEDNMINIVMISRYQENKDPKWLLDPLNYLYSNKRRKFRVILAGRGSEYYNYSYPFLVNMGTIDEKKKIELLTGSDLSIMSSRYEFYGLVALESVALGTPVLFSEQTGVAEVLVDGSLPTNEKDLIEVLDNYLDHKALEELYYKQIKKDIMKKTWNEVAKEIMS